MLWQKKVKIFTMMASVVSLSACGHMPLSSMVTLRHFDATTTDISQLSVAVDVPDNFNLGRDGVKMLIQMNSKDGATRHQEELTLTRTANRQDLIEIAKLSKAGRQIYGFRIHPDDFERIEAIRSLKLNDDQNSYKGSVSIDTTVCRYDNDVPNPVLVSTLIKTQQTETYVPLLVNVDIAKQAGYAHIDEWAPLCETNSSQ